MNQELIERNAKNYALFNLDKPGELMQFIDWIAQPAPLRIPKTQNDLATLLDVSIATLSDWKKRPGFWDEVKERTIFWGRERTPNVIAALYRKAVKEGNAFESKLWLQYIEGWKEKTEVDQRSLNKTIIITRGENEYGNQNRPIPGTTVELAQEGIE